MDKSPKDGAAEQAKHLAEDFLRTLGLMDLIRGGLILYWTHLWYGSINHKLFPSTGLSFLDVALLACAAAFSGQAFSLIVNALVALIDLLLVERLAFFDRLKDALSKRTDIAGASRALNEADQIDVATYLVTADDPQSRSLLERLSARVELGYSAGLLSIPYIAYLVRTHAPYSLVAWIVIGAIVLLVMGLINRLDLIQELAMRVAPRNAPPKAG